tara:strand:+ start:36204 stop:37001 length:798 start_codon:yes stop_codon:yes gene_type:complete
MNYKNNIVWITGASSGIGEAFAKKFFEEGAKLILSSRRIEALEEVRNSLGGDNSNCYILPLDLADPTSLPKKAEEALAAFGTIDVLVNNGGISQRSVFAETDMETIRRLMEVNFFGSAELARVVLPTMMQKKNGHIIVTSSVAGKFGTKFRSGYAASKHALHGLFDCIRQEMYEYNVAVTMVCPGPIKTNITQNSLTADGSNFGKMGDLHKTAMDADEMVDRIWTKIKKRKEEIYVSSPKENLALLVKRISPRLLNIILKNSKVT